MGEEVVVDKDDDSSSACNVTVGKFEFDLVPAANFDQDPKEQCKRARELISKAPDQSYLYSSALTEDAVDFVKGYTDKYAAFGMLVRLVKLWNRIVDLSKCKPKKISGRSLIFELIAIHVWEAHRTDTLLNLFLRFLGQMIFFRSLRVSFSTGPDPPTGNCLEAAAQKSKLSRPVILDPVNKVNDLGAAFDKVTEAVQVFEDTASQWLQTLVRKGNSEEAVIRMFASQGNAVPPQISSLVNRCEWLLDVRNSQRITQKQCYYSKECDRTTVQPLILYLKKLLNNHPTIARASSTSEMEAAIIAILSGLESKPLKMQPIMMNGRHRQRCSSSHSLSSFNQCPAYMVVSSSPRRVKATVGFQLV